MKKILIIASMLVCFSARGFAQNDATEIRTANELAAITASMEGSYILMNDLVVENWTPIGGLDGDEENGFAGTFDGNGYTITINGFDTALDNTRVGLFGMISNGGIVKNLRVAGDVDYTGGQKILYVGGMAGINEGLIQCCVSSIDLTCGYVEAQEQKRVKPVTGYEGMWIGGCFTGVNMGAIINCYSDGAISLSQGWAAGIAGANGKPVMGSFGISVGSGGVGIAAGRGAPVKKVSGISYCYSTASVTGMYAHGITAIHRADSGDINNCVVMCRAIVGRGGTASPLPGGVGGGLSVSHPNFQYYFLDDLDIRRYDVDGSEKRPARISLKRAIARSATQNESWWRLPEGVSEQERKTILGFSFGTEDEQPWKWDENLNRPILYWEN